MDAIKAKKKPVNIWQVEADLGLSQAESGRAEQLRICIPRLVLSFTASKICSKAKPAAEIADQLIDALLQENVLKGGA